MEQLQNGFTLDLCDGAFPLSTDSMVLADFTKLPRNANILDLGSGCGTLGLLLCARNAHCKVTGIELDERAHFTAQTNIARNNLSDRMESICADLTTIPAFMKPGSFSVCVSNPPYLSSGPESSTHPVARQEQKCPLEALLKSAAWALKYGGDLFLVHRPERLAELFFQACSHGLEPKRLCLMHHRENGPISLVLVHCRKGAKPGLKWETLHLFDAQGTPSDAYRSLYHL